MWQSKEVRENEESEERGQGKNADGEGWEMYLFKQKTAYESYGRRVGSEKWIRESQ